ncbi:hypothetical protein MUN89_09465 [Halobacillus salinarum]|uniref:Lipoprotein n=1 Tax=Halobacillus salinarum TaxID=2932257 RepID=A0ABY4EQ49_9BACI|nr:hypothetical protein [Halobacillus salinarum]UOQ46115.1 hypothetical protein MUN89_09465 [Halobacillus salinarum]
MNKFTKVGIMLLGVLFLLNGCGLFKSEEDMLKDTNEKVKKAFFAEPLHRNKDTDHLSMYLPKDMTVSETEKNNIVLTKGNNQTIIIFYNSMEDKSSQLNYQAAKKKQDRLLLNTYDKDDRFGYLLVTIAKDDQYEIQVGVGGAKLTTMTKKGDMEEDAEEMMKIAQSIQYSNPNK